MLIKRRKNIINFIMINCFFHLKKLESPSPKDALCQSWLKFCSNEEPLYSQKVNNVFFLLINIMI